MMRFTLTLLSLVVCAFPAISQNAPLQLTKTIQLNGVSGKFDHFAFDQAKHRLFVAATGNHSVEIVDVDTGKTVESIKGLDKPHGLAWVPNAGRLFVADGTLAALNVYSGSPLALVGTVKLSTDADDMVYDSNTKLLYVGHGGGDATEPGRIAVVDTASLKLVDNLATAAHPEALDIDEAGDRIFANIADAAEVLVVDGRNHAIIQHWPLTKAKANVPIAFVAGSGSVLVGCRTPAALLLMDGKTGREIATLPASAGTDDLFYDSTTHRAFLIAGSGNVNVFQLQGNTATSLATVHTSPGAKTALLVPSLRTLFVGEPGLNGNPSQIAVYSIKESQ